MKKKLANNLGIKILSLGLAAILWIVIVNIDNPVITRTFKNVPVKLLNEDVIKSAHKVYEIKEGEMVDVLVKGKKSIIDSLQRTDINAEADLSKLSDFSEYHAVKIDLAVTKNGAESVEVSTGKTHTLVVKLEAVKSSKFKVNVVQIGTVEGGYSIGELRAKPNIVTVTGAKSVISKIVEVRVDADVSNVTNSFNRELEPKAYDADGKLVTSKNLNFSTPKISVVGILYNTKTIPIEVNVEGVPKEGYKFQKLEYEPKKIAIAGTDAALKKIDKIVIPFDITDANGDKEEEINIVDAGYLPENVKPSDETQTTIVFNLKVEKEEIKEITLRPADIQVKNLPNTGNTKFNFDSEKDVIVKIQGLSSKIEGLTKTEIYPYIDLKGLKNGKHVVKIEFKLPKDVKLIDTPSISIELTNKNADIEKPNDNIASSTPTAGTDLEGETIE